MSDPDDWFAVRRLPDDVWLVSEPGHVNSFLVVGTERAALVDSGLGIGDVERATRRLTDLPVTVVNTHYHFDHVGGNAAFADIAIHEAGVEPLGRPLAAEELRGYAKWAKEMLANLEGFLELDEKYFGFLTRDATPRPFPPGFDADAWEIPGSRATRLLHDGDWIDLGGRALRVLHTPGHTPDSICLFDEEAGVLFGGDTINTGPIYAQGPDSNVEAFARSTARLAEAASKVRVVYVAHFSNYAADSMFLEEVAEGFDAIVAGRCEWGETVDVMGDRVREARFRTFSVLVAL